MCYQTDDANYFIDKRKKMLKAAVIAVSISVLLFWAVLGCSGNRTVPTKPVDVAAEAGKQISKAFLLIYNTAKEWTERGTPGQKEYALTKLNPEVNQAKKLVVQFDRAVAAWQRTGQGGEDVIKKQQALEDMYDHLQNLIIDAFANKEI